METVGVTIRPRGGSFAPVDGELAAADGVDRETVLDIAKLSDRSVVALYRLSGDVEAAHGAIEGADGVRSFDVATREDGDVNAFLHIEEAQPLSGILDLTERHGLLFQRPIKFTDRGVYITLTGLEPDLQRAFEDVPEGATAKVQQVGGYTLDESDLVSRLTRRQREALETAKNLGYYATPRRATCEDVASQLDCTASTANELLRRAETAVITGLLET